MQSIMKPEYRKADFNTVDNDMSQEKIAWISKQNGSEVGSPNKRPIRSRAFQNIGAQAIASSQEMLGKSRSLDRVQNNTMQDNYR